MSALAGQYGVARRGEPSGQFAVPSVGEAATVTVEVTVSDGQGGSDTATIDVAVEPEPHEVLGVASDAPESVVKAAAKQMKKEKHPDRGGSTEEFQRVVEAEEKLLQEGSGSR